MNSFTLGKLAEIYIQRLVESADEGRKARRDTSPCLTPRFKHHLHWRRRIVMRPVHGCQ